MRWFAVVIRPHGLITPSEYSTIHYEENRGINVPTFFFQKKPLCVVQRNQNFQRACFLESALDLRFGVDVNTSFE